jgi:hypothetical protein
MTMRFQQFPGKTWLTAHSKAVNAFFGVAIVQRNPESKKNCRKLQKFLQSTLSLCRIDFLLCDKVSTIYVNKFERK